MISLHKRLTLGHEEAFDLDFDASEFAGTRDRVRILTNASAANFVRFLVGNVPRLGAEFAPQALLDAYTCHAWLSDLEMTLRDVGRLACTYTGFVPPGYPCGIAFDFLVTIAPMPGAAIAHPSARSFADDYR